MTTSTQAPEFDRSSFFRDARRTAGKVPLVRDAVASYFAMLDESTPKWAKAAILAGLAYFVCPVDAIPDALAVFGYTDDAAAIGVMLSSVRAVLKVEHYEKARNALS